MAQSHLADIERSLKVLRCDLEKVLDMLDSEDRANLTGTIDYLKGIAEFLQSHQSPSEMPMQIRNQVETIVRGFHIWRDKLDNDMCNAVDRVKKQSDLDKLGNQNTFIAMQGHLGDAAKLSTRRELLRNMFMVLKVVTIYADPMGMQFSKFQLDEDLWTKRAKEFNDAFYAQTNSLFTKVLFASDETLGLKRDYLSIRNDDLLRIELEHQGRLVDSLALLDSNVDGFYHSDAGMRVALSFDDVGHVREAALL